MSIDTKIMLHRATDFAREASAIQKKGDITHAFAMKQMEENTQMQKTKVNNSKRRDENTIQREREKNGQKDGGSREKKEDVLKKGDGLPEAAPEESIIDIRI